MAQWGHLYYNEDYEAEILVGPYDHWLRQLEFGPTQADRVLVHTNMMEHAHERRFAVCEAGIDLAHFEHEHSQRIRSTINYLDTHFAAHTSREVDEPERYCDQGLIGLTKFPVEAIRKDCSQFAVHHSTPPAFSIPGELHLMLQQAETPNVVVQSPVLDTLMADTNYMQVQQEVYEELLTSRKNFYRGLCNKALTMKPVRYRRAATRPAMKGMGERGRGRHVGARSQPKSVM